MGVRCMCAGGGLRQQTRHRLQIAGGPMGPCPVPTVRAVNQLPKSPEAMQLLQDTQMREVLTEISQAPERIVSYMQVPHPANGR